MLSKGDERVSGLEAKILSKNARLGVVSLGYVGLPLALAFVRAGFVQLIYLFRNQCRNLQKNCRQIPKGR